MKLGDQKMKEKPPSYTQTTSLQAFTSYCVGDSTHVGPDMYCGVGNSETVHQSRFSYLCKLV